MARTRPAALALALVAVLTACGGDPEPVASSPDTTPSPSVRPMLPGATEPTPTDADGAPSRDPAVVLADVEITGITGDTPFQQEAIALLRTYVAEVALAQATNDTSRPELMTIFEPTLLMNLQGNIAAQAAEGEYVRGTLRVDVITATELSNGTDIILEVCISNEGRDTYSVADDTLLDEGTGEEDGQFLLTRRTGTLLLSSLVAGQPGLCDGTVG